MPGVLTFFCNSVNTINQGTKNHTFKVKSREKTENLRTENTHRSEADSLQNCSPWGPHRAQALTLNMPTAEAEGPLQI